MQVVILKNIIRKADIFYPSPCISGKLATVQEWSETGLFLKDLKRLEDFKS